MSTVPRKRPARVRIPAAGRSVIHEFDQSKSRMHRIIIVENGVPDVSPWAGATDFVQYKGIIASTNSGPLPSGVYRVSTVAHQNLGLDPEA